MAEGHDIHIFVSCHFQHVRMHNSDMRQTLPFSVWIPTVSTETGNQILQ